MAKEYMVLSITEMTRIADVGGIEKFYRHRVKSKGGVVITVDIDEKDFTPELAAPILSAAAKNADAVKALGG